MCTVSVAACEEVELLSVIVDGFVVSVSTLARNQAVHFASRAGDGNEEAAKDARGIHNSSLSPIYPNRLGNFIQVPILKNGNGLSIQSPRDKEVIA